MLDMLRPTEASEDKLWPEHFKAVGTGFTVGDNFETFMNSIGC